MGFITNYVMRFIEPSMNSKPVWFIAEMGRFWNKLEEKIDQKRIKLGNDN